MSLRLQKHSCVFLSGLTILLGIVAFQNLAFAGKMKKKELEKQWVKLKKKGWSRAQVKKAVLLSEGDQKRFNQIKKLVKNNVPLSAIQQTYKLCKGNHKAVGEFWNYVKKYKFSPSEVAEVFKTFPPNKIQRYKYFVYRAGGPKQLEARAKKGKGKEKGKEKEEAKGKAYSAEEVMKIFKAVGFDVGLVDKYFTQRKAGVPPQKAWAKVRDELKAKVTKERERKEKKQKEEEERRKAREEKLRKLKEYQQKQKEAKQKDDDKEKVKTTTLSSLLGKDKDDEKSTDSKKDKQEDETKKDTDSEKNDKDKTEKKK